MGNLCLSFVVVKDRGKKELAEDLSMYFVCFRRSHYLL